jgi:hypothetical protein
LAEQIKPEEELARACASLSTPDLQRLVNALQAYHGMYYAELCNAGPDTVMRAQGKVQATSQIVNVVLGSREIVEKINNRRAVNSKPAVNGVGVM